LAGEVVRLHTSTLKTRKRKQRIVEEEEKEEEN
jgi:hypothetical protein